MNLRQRKQFYPEYIKSQAWLEKRQEYFTKNPYRCYVCHYPKNLHLHHKTYKRLGKEHLSDLIYLCCKCHDFLHRIYRTRNHDLWSIARKMRKAYGTHSPYNVKTFESALESPSKKTKFERKALKLSKKEFSCEKYKKSRPLTPRYRKNLVVN